MICGASRRDVASGVIATGLLMASSGNALVICRHSIGNLNWITVNPIQLWHCVHQVTGFAILMFMDFVWEPGILMCKAPLCT